MTPHLACTVVESSQIGDARRQAARLAASLDFDEVAAGRLGLVVSELATNLVRHAGGGTLLVGACSDESGGTCIELVSMDRGPGMANLEDSMTDGVSTGGTSGTGLGAVRRLSQEFLGFSVPGEGTILVSRVSASSRDEGSAARPPPSPASPVRFAGFSVAAPGEVVSGDSWALRQQDQQVALLMADGLGHGEEAAKAADQAVKLFREGEFAGPGEVIDRCHAGMRGTRGAAVSVAKLDLDAGQLTFCGAGNVAARLLTGVEDRSLLSQHGTVGLQIRKPQDLRYDLPRHGLLVMHSDGLQSRWSLKHVPELLVRDPVIIAAYLLRDQLRGRDDATVVVVRYD